MDEHVQVVEVPLAGLDPAEVRLVDPEPAGNQLVGQRVRDVERMLR
ncbi:MAG: hypothetical protein ACRDYA_03180 [Egibacteraceae bacterium]